ncbi:MAG: hypothetical protein HN948_02145 [Clostridia bacterium]|jgi:hypothetical protein|nr:hypothetical protein [Clostridia bacterium]MBT7121791.1 hypothetical protein [Clostridia bacterium]
MYNIKMNKIEDALSKLALNTDIFENDSPVDDKVLNSYKEVIMDIEMDTPKKQPKRQRSYKGALIGVAAALAAAVVIAVLAITGVFAPAGGTAAYVALEINPSIVLEIDNDDNVQSVAFASEDAAAILEGVDLKGTNSINAIGTVVALAKREGYFDPPSDVTITLTLFGNKDNKDQYMQALMRKINEVLGFEADIITKTGSLDEGSAFIKFMDEQPMAQTDPQEPSTSTQPQPPPPTATPVPSPTASPTPALPAADSAGSGDVLFDIYDTDAVADINNDGSDDTISFVAGGGSSTLTVNGVAYTINENDLAQKFAITDVDISDGWIEIAFCDVDDAPEHDLDLPNTYYYWWDGSTFIECGSFWDMGWDGAARASFDATEHMDGHGMIMSLDRSPNFTDMWYMAHWELNGANRQKKEDLYATVPLYPIPDLTLKKPCILLKNIDLAYFEFSMNVMWDHASWPHSEGRAIDPGGTGDVVIIAQNGETLEVVKVYGKRWFKLKTADGYQGWIRVVSFEMSGYDDVMYIDAWDIFDGIFVAG